MKIVVMGGTGFIGSKLVEELRSRGHDVVPAALDTGVDTLTGAGLAPALDHATSVVDVSNSPSYEDAAVLDFFETSTRNLLDAEAAEGIRHHVVLSIVGTERLAESAYFRGKLAQEKLIESSSIPYSIVRATQFFEFLASIADAATDGDHVRLPPVLFQPIAADDVVGALARVALGTPANGAVQIAGPEQFRLDDLVRQCLLELRDPRDVIADAHATYFGAELREHMLVPSGEADLAATRFDDWITQQAKWRDEMPRLDACIGGLDGSA